MVDDGDQPPPAPRSVQFAEVEVIELPIVAGENHPSRLWKKKSKADESTVDSAAITLGWEAQTRTTMNLNDYEEKKKKLRVKKKLQRMSRAVRKRM